MSQLFPSLILPSILSSCFQTPPCRSNGEDRNEPTPKSDYATRVNEVFEETQYSPSSNPFGHRPDQRTSAGAQAARKRLSLEGETLHADGNNNGGGRSNVMCFDIIDSNDQHLPTVYTNTTIQQHHCRILYKEHFKMLA